MYTLYHHTIKCLPFLIATLQPSWDVWSNGSGSEVSSSISYCNENLSWAIIGRRAFSCHSSNSHSHLSLSYLAKRGTQEGSLQSEPWFMHVLIAVLICVYISYCICLSDINNTECMARANSCATSTEENKGVHCVYSLWLLGYFLCVYSIKTVSTRV